MLYARERFARQRGEFVYYSTISGVKKEIPLDFFEKKMHINAAKKGKRAKYEFLRIDEDKEVWLNNKLTMEALWNIIIWLEKESE